MPKESATARRPLSISLYASSPICFRTARLSADSALADDVLIFFLRLDRNPLHPGEELFARALLVTLNVPHHLRAEPAAAATTIPETTTDSGPAAAEDYYAAWRSLKRAALDKIKSRCERLLLKRLGSPMRDATTLSPMKERV